MLSLTVTFPSSRFEDDHGGPFESVEAFQEYLENNCSELWSEPEICDSDRHDWSLDDGGDIRVDRVVPDEDDPVPVRRVDAVDAYRLHRPRPAEDFELLDFGDGRWGLVWAPFRPIAVRTSPEAILELVATAGTPEYVYLVAQFQTQRAARHPHATIPGETP